LRLSAIAVISIEKIWTLIRISIKRFLLNDIVTGVSGEYDLKSKVHLSICIVSYNVREYLEKCLVSVYQTLGDLNAEVLLVDNASKDGSLEMVKERFPQVRTFPQEKNLGFAAANNVALEASEGQYLILLNPDTECRENSLSELIAYLEQHPDCGIVGPKLLNEDGSIQNGLRQFPSPLTVFARHTLLKRLPFFTHRIDQFHMRHFNLKNSADVDQVSGAAMMFSRVTMEKIGMLDESFFIFFEEVDYCRRARNLGLKVHYHTACEIVHFGGKSRDQINSKARIIYMESQLKYLRKHVPKMRFVFFIFFFKLFFCISSFINCILDIPVSLVYRIVLKMKPEFRDSKKYRGFRSKSHFRRFFLFQNLPRFLFKM